MNKKEKRLALKSVLTSKVQENKFLVLDELKLDVVKTKDMKKVLDNLKVDKALVVIGNDSENVALSARNIPGVQTASVNTINVYDILKYNTVIATKSSVASHRGGVRIMAKVLYYDVILKPLVTEKSMNAMGEKKYAFLVHPEANKTMIKEAVEKMFEGTKVKSVNTMNLDGKTKRRGLVYGKTAKTKKAIVALTEDSKDIEIFQGL